MPNRILRESALDSDRIASVDEESEVLFYRLLLVADDFGRFDGRIQIIRSRVYALRPEISEAETERRLRQLQEAGLVRRYEVAGKPFIEIERFNQRNRSKISKYPAEGDTTTDRSYEGYVYAIGNGNRSTTKIGYSQNPWARAKEFSVATDEELSVLFCARWPKNVEKELHGILAPLRKKGEWFQLDKEILGELQDALADQSVDVPSLLRKIRSCPSIIRSCYAPTEAESEAESEAKTYPPYGPPPNGELDLPELPEFSDRRKEPHDRPKAKATRLDPDWRPGDWDREYARERGFEESEIDDIAANFLTHYTAGRGRSTTFTIWSGEGRSAWANWIRRETPGRGSGGRAAPGGRGDKGGVAAALRRLEDRDPGEPGA